MPAKLPEMTLKQYLNARCKWVGKCFEFQGSRPKGYGIFMIPGTRKMMQTHRAMYEACKGPIPKGKIVQHSCDNPACCNIKHLSLGTHKTNAEDSLRKGRRNKHNGMNPKFNAKDHKRIKRLAKVMSRREIAESMGCSVDTIARILRGETVARKPGEVARIANEARWGKSRK